MNVSIISKLQNVDTTCTTCIMDNGIVTDNVLNNYEISKILRGYQ